MCIMNSLDIHATTKMYEPTLNRSSTVWHFEHSDVIKIRNEIIFDIYMGLSHTYADLSYV